MEITVERVRHALVVGRLDADGAAVVLAANLPPKRDRTFVVVGASSVDAMRRLDPWVVADLADEVRGDLCVVAPGFGSMGPDGTLPPARLLADRLGVEVTAADGDPVGLADGSVFVPGPAAGWVSYRPGGRRTRVGARFPAPWWQDGLPEEAEHLTHVPVGLWLRAPGGDARPGDPLLRQVPDRDRLYVVLGAPGEQPPPGETVTEVLRALPDEARDRAVLAWYGAAGQAGELVRAVADALGAPVRVAHGVPGDGGLVHVDEHGTARWRPFAVESVYRPGGARPVLDRWVAPPRLPMVEPGSFRLVPGWRVDVVPRGLVVRPDTVPPDPAVLTALAVETGPTADIVFATDGPVPGAVLPALDRLVRELPADTKAALRILPVDEAAAAALTGAEAADHVAAATTLLDGTAPEREHAVPPVGRVVVTADGRILPEEPILATPAPRVVVTAPVALPPEPPAPTAALDIQNGVLVVADEVDEEERAFDAVAPEHAEEEAAAPEFLASADPPADPEPVVDGFAPAIGPVVDATAVPDETAGFVSSARPAEDARSEPVGFASSVRPAEDARSGPAGFAPSAHPAEVARNGPAGFAASAHPAEDARSETAGFAASVRPAEDARSGPVGFASSAHPAEVARSEPVGFTASAAPGAPGGEPAAERPVDQPVVARSETAGFAASAHPAEDARSETAGFAASVRPAEDARSEPVGFASSARPAEDARSEPVGFASSAHPAEVARSGPAGFTASAAPGASVGEPAAERPVDQPVVARSETAGFASSASPAEVARSGPAGFTASAAPGASVGEPAAERPVDQPVVPAAVAPAVATAEEDSHLADLANVAAAGTTGGIPSVAAATAVPAIVPAAQPEQAPEPAPVASVAGLLPGREPARSPVRGAAIEVPENARSTVAQRRAMRAKLGSRYDVATRAVTRLLSERPGLRFGAGDHAALLAELAVVRVFADDPAGDYDTDFYVCLADGLRRLPTARAVVVRGIPEGTDARPGAVLRLPAPLVAAPATAPEPVGPAEALIWTTTARRLDGLLDDPPPPDPDGDEPPAPRRGADVVLAGHTRLRVLAIAPTPVRRVLLAEDGAASDAALTRLLAAAAAREEAVATTDTSRWFGALPAAG
ncbi:hypothetical protein [Actinophytocola sp. KF-1]